MGVIIAIVTALAWAGSGTLLKYLSSRIDAISINTMRLWVGSIILLTFVLLSGRGDKMVHSSSFPVLMIAVSGIVAIAAGDTVYIKSLSYMDVSRAYPISQCTFPVLTLFTAIFFFGESFAWFNIMGAALVLIGIYMVVRKNKGEATDKATGTGVMLSLLAAVLWAGGAVALKIGVTGVDSFVAAAIRISVAALALTGLMFGLKNRDWPKFTRQGARNLLLVVSTGILTYGVGAVGYVNAMQLIGVGKTVLLTAAAPLFLLPLSMLILKERPPIPALFGVIVSVAGICLVAL